MNQQPCISVVIVAAGRGERAGGLQDGPKQYRRLGGKSVLARTIGLFAKCARIDRICIVVHRDDHDLAERSLAEAQTAGTEIIRVTGAETRQLSVLAGLRALKNSAPPDFVLVHDAVRPFLDDRTLEAVLNGLDENSGLIVGLPITDTVKRTDRDGAIVDTPRRDGLFRAQTPQAFSFEAILAAHEDAERSGVGNLTDDSAVAEWAGLPVRVLAGSSPNPKLTFKEDFILAEQTLGAFPDVRVGNGYDVHRFGEGQAVVLCGVSIPHDRALSGHSDADVCLHALTDALLATIGAGDIGTHFPPSDPQWRGAASSIFVQHAVALVREKGGRIANADITVIAEEPKVGPHRSAMTECLSSLLKISRDRVSIKATTNETMGFIGRGEGIAAIATVSVVYPGGLDDV